MKKITLFFVLSVSLQFSGAVVTRNDRIWPLGAGSTVDLPQATAYGPKQYFSKYSFHRGIDIPTPKYTNVYAVADGTVKIAGASPSYKSGGVVQLRHTNWEEDPNTYIYSNYMLIVMSKEGGADPIVLTEGQQIQKGQLIAYTYGTSNLDHLEFQIRHGGRYSKHCSNPWKYLPNDANDYSSFDATLSLTPNYHGIDCEAVVNVSVPQDQLTFNRIELHIVDNNDQPQEVRVYDMIGANFDHSKTAMDDWEYQDDPSDSSSYVIRISPDYYNGKNTEDDFKYGFEFLHLPIQSGSGKVMAKVFDVFDNSVSTGYQTYTCLSGTSGPPTLVARNDRVWPIGNSASVDLPQSSPFGPRLKISESSRYDFHRGVDIPTPLYSNVYAIADGIVRIAGSHPNYTDGVVQITHNDWEEDPNSNFYSTYIHVVMSKENDVDPITLTVGQAVQKGDIIAYSNKTDTLEHIHFEIRVGGLFQRHCCNPWKYLPNVANDYSSFTTTDFILTPNYHDIDCEAVVNVSVPPDQLTFNRIELHILDNNHQPQEVRFYDMCGANLDHTFEDMDDWEYQDDPADSSSYVIRISPDTFNSQSFQNGESASYGFEFIDLPALSGSGKVMAKVFDSFGNSLTTVEKTYTCSL